MCFVSNYIFCVIALTALHGHIQIPLPKRERRHMGLKYFLDYSSTLFRKVPCILLKFFGFGAFISEPTSTSLWVAQLWSMSMDNSFQQNTPQGQLGYKTSWLAIALSVKTSLSTLYVTKAWIVTIYHRLVSFFKLRVVSVIIKPCFQFENTWDCLCVYYRSLYLQRLRSILLPFLYNSHQAGPVLFFPT